MGAVGKYLRSLEGGMLAFECPGCGCMHGVTVEGDAPGPRWTYNGNPDKPTFSPSILVRYSHWVPPGTTPEIRQKIESGEIVQTEIHDVCHSFVTDGRIQFLGDCTHALAGQTVDLPPWEE